MEEQHKALVNGVHTAIEVATADRKEMKESIKALEDVEKEAQTTLTEIQVSVAGMRSDMGWVKESLATIMKRQDEQMSQKKNHTTWKIGGLLGGGGALGAIGVLVEKLLSRGGS